MIERVREFFRTFLLFELVKGMMRFLVTKIFCKSASTSPSMARNSAVR